MFIKTRLIIYIINIKLYTKNKCFLKFKLKESYLLFLKIIKFFAFLYLLINVYKN